jgi:hypothetical protein
MIFLGLERNILINYYQLRYQGCYKVDNARGWENETRGPLTWASTRVREYEGVSVVVPSTFNARLISCVFGLTMI